MDISTSELDDRFVRGGIYFLPWVGQKYNEGVSGRKLLVLGESHYDTWDNVKRDLPPQFTRECIEYVLNREHAVARFWKYIEQALLNESRANGWAPSGGPALWSQIAFYNFVQSPVNSGSRQAPTNEQFARSIPPFRTLLEELRPERVLVCGKRLWSRMDRTHSPLHDCIQAYQLSDGVLVWCLAIVHPSSGRFSWCKTHQLIQLFLDNPGSAVSFLA